MARGEDSDEERHDRFRSERNTVVKPSIGFSTGTRRSPLSSLDGSGRGGSRRSRDRSKERRRDRSRDRDRRLRSRERRPSDRDRKENRRKSSSRERRKHRSEERHSSSRSDSRSRSSRATDKKSSSHRESRDNSSSADKFAERYERRRPSVDGEEEIDDHLVVYRDTTPSPEKESKKSKKKNGEKKHKKERRKRKKEKSVEDEETFGSVVPPGTELRVDEVSPKRVKDDSGVTYGPQIPPKAPRENGTDSSKVTLPEDNSSMEEGELISPQTKKVYGPQLPLDDSSFGPSLPPPTQIDSDDDLGIGPLPPGVTVSRAAAALDKRAAYIKSQMENKVEDDSKEPKREEWMIELPEGRRADLGLGARKFRARAGPDLSDRSSWTDTPKDKEKKEEMAKLGFLEGPSEIDDTKTLGIRERDKEMEKRAKQGKTRDKSLLELHQKDIKKKKKKVDKDKKEERRPFNREIDLQANRFDEAQKKSIIKKAQLLDSRFSTGESKYL